MGDLEVILWGEIRCWSLLGVEGLIWCHLIQVWLYFLYFYHIYLQTLPEDQNKPEQNNRPIIKDHM